MRKFTNPLDSIHIASPCSANWNEMYGNERKRFCGRCKLNVYNLSDMTRQEAENLLLSSEGRLCVQFFRRADGTVLTKNCPVGWQAVRRRVWKIATAAFSIFAGLFTGVTGFNLLTRLTESISSFRPIEVVGAVPVTAVTQGEASPEPNPADGESNYEVLGVAFFPPGPIKKVKSENRRKNSK